MDEFIREAFLRADEQVCATDRETAASKNAPRNNMIPGPGAVAVRLFLADVEQRSALVSPTAADDSDCLKQRASRLAARISRIGYRLFSLSKFRTLQVVAVVIGRMLHVAWVGDSRCIIEDGATQRLTICQRGKMGGSHVRWLLGHWKRSQRSDLSAIGRADSFLMLPAARLTAPLRDKYAARPFLNTFSLSPAPTVDGVLRLQTEDHRPSRAGALAHPLVLTCPCGVPFPVHRLGSFSACEARCHGELLKHVVACLFPSRLLQSVQTRLRR